jgi:hypothetical protein
MFFGFLETVAGKASAVINTTVALAGYLSLARTLQKIHALLADPGERLRAARTVVGPQHRSMV